MIFLGCKSKPETIDLHKTIDISQPSILFNMHDESHFPADGYKMAFSSPVTIEILGSHLVNVKQFMEVSAQELIITHEYGHDPQFSISPAFNLRNDVFSFLNEPCGYKQIVSAPIEGPLGINSPVGKGLRVFKELIEENYSTELETALFHVKLLIESIETGKKFNSKMLSITGYGLEYLIRKNIFEANDVKQIFLGHVLDHFSNVFSPIPVWQQVFIQLDLLFTILK